MPFLLKDLFQHIEGIPTSGGSRALLDLPLHWTPDGLPMGVQFVGPLGGDGLSLRLAAQLEQAAPWWDRRPPA